MSVCLRTIREDFNLVDSEMVERHMAEVSSASSISDPMPAQFFKSFWRSNIVDIVDMINSALTSRIFQSILKEGIIKPLLKPGEDKETPGSYRPVTNLKWLGKLPEPTAHNQLTTHLDAIDKWPVMQSAYRKSHSTETSLIWFPNVICKMTSRNKSLLMVSLNLSRAFDTVQHHLMTDILKSFGLDGAVANFFIRIFETEQ